MAEFGGQTTLLNEMSQQGSKVLDTSGHPVAIPRTIQLAVHTGLVWWEEVTTASMKCGDLEACLLEAWRKWLNLEARQHC
jgi:hypothetical protein